MRVSSGSMHAAAAASAPAPASAAVSAAAAGRVREGRGGAEKAVDGVVATHDLLRRVNEEVEQSPYDECVIGGGLGVPGSGYHRCPHCRGTGWT